MNDDEDMELDALIIGGLCVLVPVIVIAAVLYLAKIG
jgi:hypothetical protein